MTGPARILLIMADAMLRQTVAEHLGAAMGLTVTEAADLDAGLAVASAQDLIVVDETAPDQGICRHLRGQGITAPLLLLSAAAAPPPCCAVDGVVAKPLRLTTLTAKITELLTRRPDPVELRLGPWLLDARRRQLVGEKGKVVRLTDKEIAILCRLAHAGGTVVSRDILLSEIWGYSSQLDTHTLETHIYRLRRKIEAGPGRAGLLLSEGGGYRLNTESPP
jgi:DNA-binding response OmpR family regulator